MNGLPRKGIPRASGLLEGAVHKTGGENPWKKKKGKGECGIIWPKSLREIKAFRKKVCRGRSLLHGRDRSPKSNVGQIYEAAKKRAEGSY